MFKEFFASLLSRLLLNKSETHVVIYDEDDDEFPKSYVVRNKRELKCLLKSLKADDLKNIRQHRLFSGLIKGAFYLLMFYLLSDVILDLLYRFHALMHEHNLWDVPMLIDEYLFNDKQGFPGHPLQ